MSLMILITPSVDGVQVRRVALLTDRALYLAQYDVKNKKPVENKVRVKLSVLTCVMPVLVIHPSFGILHALLKSQTWRRYDLSTLQCIDVGPSEGSSKFNDVYLALYFQVLWVLCLACSCRSKGCGRGLWHTTHHPPLFLAGGPAG